MDISSIFGEPRLRSVSDAIRDAATATGTSFQYLLAAAQAESGLNPQAASPTSSARGLYQFIDQTWLATMKRAGPALGYGKYADAIVQSATGHFDVPDPVMRRDIMALRVDPTANAAMAGVYTRDNAAALAGSLGRQASDRELYLAHVLGLAGAVKLTSLATSHPDAAADAAFPAAADANRSIFYDRQGRPRTALDVYGTLVGRYDGARNAASSPSPRTAGEATRAKVATAPATMTAGMPLTIVPGVPTTDPVPPLATPAGTNADSTGRKSAPMFNGLFSDRTGPVSQVVQDMWTSPPGSPAAPSRAASLVSSSGDRELFRPQSTDGSGLFGR